MENKIIVLDVCVALKPFLTEKESLKAEKLLYLKDEYKISVLVPEIFRFEFLNTLGRKIGTEASLKAYQIVTDRQVSWVPTDDEISKKALQIMERNPKVAFYDAVYHALAKVYNVEMITSDEEYYEKVKDEGNIRLLNDFKI